MDSYEIKLPQFEGPFDLLLFFIERDELDIYDIPIAKITDEFLRYISKLEDLNIEVASEFILVASSLMRIKAKMLLPRKELNEAGEEIDPREELVQRLIEYKKYKEVTAALKEMEDERQSSLPRGNIGKDLKSIADTFSVESELHSLTLYKLMKAFERAMDRMEQRQNEVRHKVVTYNYTIANEKERLVGLVSSKAKVAFDSIFEDCQDRMHCIFRFLSILELSQEKIIRLKEGIGVNNFWIMPVATTNESA